MPTCSALPLVRALRARPALRRLGVPHVRSLLTLAIETSCDDTSVAVLEKHHGKLDDGQPRAELHFHEKVTADNSQYQGVSPINSLESHQENLAGLVQKAISKLPSNNGKPSKPDFVSVTRGPGMRSSVSTGLDTAKGLAVAYGVPLLGVNHMQAHALTPRLVSALESTQGQKPAFPFLTLLVSGGHTMLLHSESVLTHKILATTSDVAIGDALDKIARVVLPEEILKSCQDVSYARHLESFVFPTNAATEYTPPITREQEVKRRDTKWGWSLGIPFAELRGGQKARSMELSFSGLDSAVRRLVQDKQSMSDDERKDLGYEAMRIAFEHVAKRTISGLDKMKELRQTHTAPQPPIEALVVSGGVAANKFMRLIFRKFLDAKGYENVCLAFPPLELCTDNAAMIAWAGMEMYEAGWESNLDVRALRKWTLDPQAPDGGIIGVGGWKRRKDWSA